MNPWIVAVVIASGITLVGLIVVVLASISTVRDLARSARRFQEDVGGLAADISSEAGNASAHAARLERPGADRPS